MNNDSNNISSEFKVPIFFDLHYEKVSESAIYLKGTYSNKEFLLIEYNISNNYEKEEQYLKSIVCVNKNKYFLKFYGLLFNKEMCQYFLVYEYPYFILDNFFYNKTISLHDKQNIFFELNSFLDNIDFKSELKLENLILTSQFVFLNKKKELKILCLGNLHYITSKTYDPELNDIISNLNIKKLKLDDFLYYKYSIFLKFYFENYQKFYPKKPKLKTQFFEKNNYNKKHYDYINISAIIYNFFKRDNEKVINLLDDENNNFPSEINKIFSNIYEIIEEIYPRNNIGLEKYVPLKKRMNNFMLLNFPKNIDSSLPQIYQKKEKYSKKIKCIYSSKKLSKELINYYIENANNIFKISSMKPSEDVLLNYLATKNYNYKEALNLLENNKEDFRNFLQLNSPKEIYININGF